MDRVAGRDEDYAALARAPSRRRRAVRLARLDASELHALHQRHDRPTEGRAARHRRLRGRARREHEAHLLRPGRRDLLLDQRHRLGRRPQLHRLRPAHRRHGDDPLRGAADPARRRHLVAAGREVPRHGDVHARRRRSACSRSRTRRTCARTTCRACALLFLAGEPLDEPTASWIADAIGKPVIDNYWQTESGWPILTVANGVAPMASKFGSPGVAMYGYDVRLVDEATGLDIDEPGQEGRRRDRRADAARLHADGLARRRALRRDLLDDDRRAPALQHLRLGHPRRRRLLLHPRPHRRRHQRRRPPPRHARDRGEHLEPCQRRRGRRRRRRRCAQGAGRDGVRRRPRRERARRRRARGCASRASS